MAWATASIKQGQRVELDDTDALTRLRDDLGAASAIRPLIVTFDAPACHVALGIAGDQGFVQGASFDGEPPYRVTLGDRSAGGVVAFFLHGEHRTEIPVRHLVSIGDAWAATAALLDTGTYMSAIEWDEV